MNKHTPGPWTDSPDAVPDYHTQLTVYAEISGERVATVFQTEANARLIAQAPAMYALLKEAYGYLVTMQPQLASEIDGVLSSVDAP